MKTKNITQRIGIIIVAIMIGFGIPEFIRSNSFRFSSEGETNLEAVKFIRTVDGDTIIVENSEGEQQRVRMIGIDTPESVAAEEERNNEYGVMASDYTKELLKDADILYLEYDVDDDDQYDRALAYVWLEDVDDTFDRENIKKSMVNAIIVENGYGIAKRYEPTVAHDDLLQDLMSQARNSKVGLWKYEGYIALWDK